MRNLTVNGERLWASLIELAQIGATPKGGVCRLAASDLDAEARRLFIRWCEAAGCAVTIDRIGNIFARRPGRNPALAPIVTGSHLDTQPTGGKFDGAYGVMAGLEVVRTLNDLGYDTEAPIEIVAWTNEEGSRFSPAMVGSGAFTGVFDLASALATQDNNAPELTLGAELRRIGFAGEAQVGEHPVAAYFEAHIEQGPILEAAGLPIGVVTGAQGQRWYEITVIGQEAHAGPTPMPRRRDALVGAARMIDAVNRIGHAHAPYACATVGFIQSSPNSRNTIPGHVFFTVDFRHPDNDVLTAMDKELRTACAEAAGSQQLEAEVKEFWYFPPTPFDQKMVGAVRAAAAAQNLPHQDIISGAGHDAVYMARVAPTAMIFVPCVGGISHNEIEDATPTDLIAGCAVLLNAVLEAADGAP
ncbi:MAG TPA: Zn-dependent hydrolase [Stellaceae bacterium]|jgi:N-carbamoyl-L-amino-acid hydrolase|nr:Zn-dependent hydrolase [Stellaceae bacterium]